MRRTSSWIPGVGIDKLFTLRTVEDTFRIKEYINKNHPKSAVLAGGGFIGLELAENLRELGMDVTIVQRPKQLMNPFDPDMASMIHNEMRKYGIKLVLGYTVEGFKEKDNGVEVLLKDNPSLQADMVVLAIGVTPDTALAKEAGLELGIKGSIVVNDRMETVQRIYEIARKKIADALIDGHPLRIEGGDFRICDGQSSDCSFGGCYKQEIYKKYAAEKGEGIMRIAVTYENGQIFQHFGHTETFKIYDVEEGKVVHSEVVDTNGSGHGALAGVLNACCR